MDLGSLLGSLADDERGQGKGDGSGDELADLLGSLLGGANAQGSQPPQNVPSQGGDEVLGTLSGGMGGVGGMGGAGAGGMGGADPTMCSAGYKCQAVGTQMICVEEASSTATACTMGGTECSALPGSICGTTPAGMVCVKACGTPAMMGCPSGLMCVNPLGIQAICSADGFLPPACTMGGTECAQYGVPCTNLMGIMGCFITCTM